MTRFEKKTNELVDFLSLIPKDHSEMSKYYMDSIEGKIKLIGLINNDKISVAQVLLTDSPETEWHSHPETEYLLLYDGDDFTMEYMNDDNEIQEKHITMNSLCYVKPLSSHRLKKSKGNSKLIVITIPGSGDFPKGQIDV